MNKLAISLSIALVSLFAANGYAQNKGGDDADQAKAAATQAATKGEKASAKQARKSEGSAATKSQAHAVEGGTPAPETVKLSKSEKKAAAAKRKAEATEARKQQTGQNPLEGSK